MDLSIRVAFSAIDKLTRPVSAASKAIGGLSDSLKNTVFNQRLKKRRLSTSCAHRPTIPRKNSEAPNVPLMVSIRSSAKAGSLPRRRRRGLKRCGISSRLTDTYNKQTTQLRAAGQRCASMALTSMLVAVRCSRPFGEQSNTAVRLSVNGSARRSHARAGQL